MAKTFKTLRDPRLGLDDQIPGRHFGYTIHEIIKDRPEYIAWLITNTQIQFKQEVVDLVTKAALQKLGLPNKIQKYYNEEYYSFFEDVPF